MKTTTLFLSLLLALISPACQQTASEETATDVQKPAAASDSNAVADSDPAVEYQPAYPTDVSSETLSEDDIAQQETTHSHDGSEEHAHDDENGHGDSEEETHDGHQH